MNTETRAHPGEILLHDYLIPFGITRCALARATGIPSRRLTDITKGRRAITQDIAVHLAAQLGTTARYWLWLQMDYEIERSRSMGARENGSGVSAAPTKP